MWSLWKYWEQTNCVCGYGNAATVLRWRVEPVPVVRGIPNEGDILFTTEAPLGNVALIPHFKEPFAIGQRLLVIQPNKNVVDSKYLLYYLQSNEFKKLLQKNLREVL